MSGGVRVLEESEVDRPTPGDRPRAWAVPVAAFVVGAFAGAVFFGPVVNPPAPEATVPDDTPAMPLAPGEEDGADGVFRAVPGFDHAIVAVIEGASGVEYLLWPQARSANTLGIPALDPDSVTIDPTGLRLGVLTPLPDAEGGLLSSGRPAAVEPVMSGVHSYAWHDSALGMMGLLRFHEGSWGLYERAAFPAPQLRVDLGPERPGTLVGFGSWGWALQGPTSFEVVRPDDRQTYAGRFLDSRPEGFLVSDDGSAWVTASVGGPVIVGSTVTAGRFSPDGTKAALLYADGMAIVSLSDGSQERYEIAAGADQLEWAGDRFVVLPRSPRGIWIVDTDTGEVSAHLTQSRVFWSGVISLSS